LIITVNVGVLFQSVSNDKLPFEYRTSASFAHLLRSWPRSNPFLLWSGWKEGRNEERRVAEID